jgi:hypothetical protein
MPAIFGNGDERLPYVAFEFFSCADGFYGLMASKASSTVISGEILALWWVKYMWTEKA